MTNAETRMTKKTLTPALCRRTGRGGAVRHSDFGIDSGFWFGHSSFRVLLLVLLLGPSQCGVVGGGEILGAAFFGPPSWFFGVDPDVFVGGVEGFAGDGFENFGGEIVFGDILQIPAVFAPVVVH